MTPAEKAAGVTALPIDLALAVAAILEQLGIPYLVGGSIASSSTAVKVDVFVAGRDPFNAERLCLPTAGPGAN
ncbi:MAG: hypothetical protein A2W29_01965 [Gemmatimonadetes bacterium RBG_16_66_8]|nr:MAG: hypothetical protein A2W29_01965 [Gemmatimonadetes bacterium RBG_16_66_8]